MEMKVKVENGSILTEKNKVASRWDEYFEYLLHVDVGKGHN